MTQLNADVLIFLIIQHYVLFANIINEKMKRPWKTGLAVMWMINKINHYSTTHEIIHKSRN